MNWNDHALSVLTESDYGVDWSRFKITGKTAWINKELLGFRFPGRKGFLSRYEHGVNLIRLLWPTQVHLCREWKDHSTGETVTIWNRDFLRIFKALCEKRRVALTGSSSSGKTFAVAVYAMLKFMSDPAKTMVMISTTAGSDAERRVWGEVRDLHRALDGIYPIGTLIDYLKVITLDVGKEVYERRDVKERDIRNGIILIPIPKGQEGENALGKVIGTKNQNVLWIIDELPHMIDDVLRPESNLEANEFFQVVGIGNANRKTDPHGRMCEPVAGWDSVSINDERWDGLAGTEVIFCHGERTANFHPAVDQTRAEASDYPFPYLSRRPYVERVAEVNGRGNAELGRRTIDYARFAIGFWYGAEVADTILSAEIVKAHGADGAAPIWASAGYETLAGFDCGFTAGGDSNEIAFGRLGKGTDGKIYLHVEDETVKVSGLADSRDGYRKDIARQVVAECAKRGCEPSGFGMDINADGGLMMQAIQAEWNTHEIVGLSSLEPPDEKYAPRFSNRVTQYWYQVVDAVGTGLMRGFNVLAGYATDLFARRYESVGHGKVAVERKVEMKKRLKRSPDRGDAFAYLVNMAIRHGFPIDEQGASATDDKDPEYWARVERLRSGLEGTQSTESEYLLGEQAALAEEVAYAN